MKVKTFLQDYIIYNSNNLIQKPKISVILPTYCRGNDGLLKRSINSVLSQTFKNFELIIVDDGSIDNTQEIIKDFMKIDNRIVYIRNEINSGLPAIRVNQGIRIARAKYIAYQFDDDVWYKNMLEVLYRNIKLNNFLFVYGQVKIISPVRQVIFGWPTNQELLFKRDCVPNNAVLHHRQLFDQCGGYDCHIIMRRTSDWDLWIRYLKNTNFVFINEILGEVYYALSNSLNQICEENIFYKNWHRYDRNEKLKNFEEYEIDDLSFFNENDKKIIQQKYINPYFKNRSFVE